MINHKNVMIFTLSLMNGNYGGTLQAYALQKAITELGYTAATNVPYKNSLTPRKIIGKSIRMIKRKLGIITDYNELPNRIDDPRIKNMISFINQNMKTIDLQNGKKTFDKTQLEKYDAAIVGSDQVWRNKYVNIPTFFLDFTENLNIKRIAYAASFGTDNISDYEPELISTVSKLVKNFDAISVREKSGALICQDSFGIKAQITLDPTMLIDKDSYIELVNKDTSVTKPTGNLFVYILDETSDKNAIINKIKTKLNLNSFKIMPETPKSKSDLYNQPEKYALPPITQWLKSFIDSEFIVTDSFHGCVFAIIFNKPFIAIGNEGRGLTRFTSLLETFDLHDRLITSAQNLSEKLVHEEIDWSAINKRINTEKTKSIQFLYKNLTEKGSTK